MAAELTPSLLLHLEQVPPDVQALLKRSRTCRKKGEWTLAEWCAMDARDACKHRGDHEGLAIAQLHLADVYCDVGELGEALGLCEEAYRILHGQAAKAQRHNEAVAAYAQGLLHERFLFGDDMQAVRWYQEALELFERAREHWASQDDKSFFKTCERASRHVERRKKRILKVRSGGEGRPGAFDVLQPDSRESALRGTITDDNRVEIDGTAYYLHSGVLPSKESDGTRYCFALSIREPSPAFPAAQEGDYVVVRLQWRLDEGELKTVWSPGVMWVSGEGEEGSWWEMGDFTLSSGGRVWFYPSSSKARVIGDSDIPVRGGPPRDPAGKIKGYIIGLLKPVSAPKRRSAPRPSTPPPPEPPSSQTAAPSSSPPPEPSADLRHLYDELLSMVGGDRGVADRLVAHERDLAPDDSPLEHVRTAITRLAWDRRAT